MGEDGIEFVTVTGVAASTDTRALTAQAAAMGAAGDDNGAERFDNVEVTQPAGLMASPAVTSTAEAVCVRRGDELVALVLIDKGAPAESVEAGETRLYGVGGDNATAVIRLRADGSIEVTAKSARNISLAVSGGGNVVLAGGTLKVARVTDPVNIGTITAIAGPYPVTFSTTLQDANGAPGAPVVGPAATLAGVVSNAGGALYVKA